MQLSGVATVQLYTEYRWNLKNIKFLCCHYYTTRKKRKTMEEKNSEAKSNRKNLHGTN